MPVPCVCVARLSADEALAAGLVSRVVPPEQLLPEAHAIADKIARWGHFDGTSKVWVPTHNAHLCGAENSAPCGSC